jgi:HEAT repeat protein
MLTVRSIIRLSLIAVILAVATLSVRAETPPLDEQLATIAMLEDTRCSDGREVVVYLNSAEPVLRRRTALALARLQDSTTVEALAVRLRSDEDIEVRRLSAFALGQIGHASALTALQTAYENEPDVELRVLVIEAIGKLQDTRGTAVCVRALTDGETNVRHQAGVALWRIADEAAIRHLLIALADPEPEVRWTVVYALEKLEFPDQVLTGLTPLEEDPSPQVRAQVARTLGRQKIPQALPVLFQLLEDDALAVRVNACRAIASIGDSSAAPQLLGRLEDPHPYVREVAATALGDIGEDVVAIRLEQVSDDPAPAVRAACGAATVKLLPPESCELVVLPMMEDADEYVRASIARALGAVNTPKVVAALRQVTGGENLRGEPAGGRERAAAAAALGELAAAAARAELLAALSDEDPAVVATAEEALAKIGARDSVVVEAVMRAVRENQSPNEPDIAAAGLAALGEMKAAPADSRSRARLSRRAGGRGAGGGAGLEPRTTCLACGVDRSLPRRTTRCAPRHSAHLAR